MWLINAASLELQWIDDPDNVRYAILSHTWGKDEVSFQDFSDLQVAKLKAGFAKISKTCQIAQSEGYIYVWVDTCCINKESSAELSEAINSMYRWYNTADVCYAYLSDLHDTEPFKGLPSGFKQFHTVGLEAHAEAALNTPFAQCRWFSRGWTLQELIAPSRVVFYDASWRRVADKTTLRHLLELITRVDANTLVDNTQLLSKSVWRRMSWAANRQTTRTEDIAYCLLGIFDINMPLIYGEGYKAFQRLQEEITRKEGDPSILLWSSEAMPLSQYRPSQYRHAMKLPLYRGAFAWAPSEFLTNEEYAMVIAKDVRYESTHLAVPTKTEMSYQSSCVLQGGVVCIMEHKDRDHQFGNYTFGTYLELLTSEGVFYRAIERMSDGYVFESCPYEQPQPQHERIPYKGQDLRLLGQHMTMLIESKKQLRVCLGIDDGGPTEPETIVPWPAHRWEEIPTWWVYDNNEIVRAVCEPAATVLGMCRYSPEVRLGDASGLRTTRHSLMVACIVGSLPALPDTAASVRSRSFGATTNMISRLFGACLVKGSNSKASLSLFEDLEDKDMEASVGLMQAKLRNSDTVEFREGMRETVELLGPDGLKKRVRVVCSYPSTAVEHNNGLAWRVRVGLEHEDGFGSEQWHAAQWEDVLPVSSLEM